MFKTLTPIFSIIIAFAIFFFFTKPLYTEVQGLKKETTGYTNAINNASQFNQKLQQLKQKKDSFDERDVERLNGLVPNSINGVGMLVNLSKLVSAHGMLLGTISVQSDDNTKASANKKVSRTPVSSGDSTDLVSSDIAFTLIGTYDQLRSLLKDMERSLVPMDIVHVSFTAVEGNLQQYAITIRTYALTPVTTQQ